MAVNEQALCHTVMMECTPENDALDLEGCKRLCAAVIEQALLDMRKVSQSREYRDKIKRLKSRRGTTRRQHDERDDARELWQAYISAVRFFIEKDSALEIYADPGGVDVDALRTLVKREMARKLTPAIARSDWLEAVGVDAAWAM